MGTSAGVLASIATSTGVPGIEVVLIGAIVIAALVLLAIRFLRRIEYGRRRAAAVPFERPMDVHRPSGRITPPGRTAVGSPQVQQMAPTFAAPRPVATSKGQAPLSGRAAPKPAATPVAAAPATGTPSPARPPSGPGKTPRTAVPANLPPLAPAPPAR